MCILLINVEIYEKVFIDLFEMIINVDFCIVKVSQNRDNVNSLLY